MIRQTIVSLAINMLLAIAVAYLLVKRMQRKI
jgi:hypothetical protein